MLTFIDLIIDLILILLLILTLTLHLTLTTDISLLLLIFNKITDYLLINVIILVTSCLCFSLFSIVLLPPFEVIVALSIPIVRCFTHFFNTGYDKSLVIQIIVCPQFVEVIFNLRVFIRGFVTVFECVVEVERVFEFERFVFLHSFLVETDLAFDFD